MVLPSNVSLTMGITSVLGGIRAMPENRKMAASSEPKNSRAPVKKKFPTLPL